MCIENIKVTIIVAIYKSEKFLDKLIQSIINQTYKNLEIILVDDGSPDNSGQICDKYALVDQRIRVIHKKNGGACEARNTGLKETNGEYVSIIDGDDWLELDYVEYLMKLIQMTKAEIAMTDKIFTTRDREQSVADEVEILTPEEAFSKIIYPDIPIGPWNKIYNVELLRINKIDFSRPWSGEGLWFSSRAVQFANRIALGHRKIYNYRLNNLESGLTNYNVQMGINALENIKYIGEHEIIKTSNTINAVKWHVWKNYNYELFLIIATNSIKEQKEKYKECKKNIRLQLISVLLHSQISRKAKIKMLIQGCFPVWYAKRELSKQKEALEQDNME